MIDVRIEPHLICLGEFGCICKYLRIQSTEVADSAPTELHDQSTAAADADEAAVTHGLDDTSKDAVGADGPDSVEPADGELEGGSGQDTGPDADGASAQQEEALPRSASRVPRPNSAQVAHLIEGYDDDFLEEQDEAAVQLDPEPEVNCKAAPATSEHAHVAASEARA